MWVARPWWTMAGVIRPRPEWWCWWLYQRKKDWQKPRASSMEPKRSGKSGRYFKVRNWLSEYGLSSETWGRECVLVTPRSAINNATGLDLIDEPRSAWMVNWPGAMSCLRQE